MSNPLFNYDVEIDPMTIDIRSETLEPISSSTRRVVFRLDAAGNLDQNSILLFKVQGDNNNRYRSNEMFGGLLSIKRATLQIGDYILNDTEDIGRIAALTSMASMNVATRNQLLGHYYHNQYHSLVQSAYNSASAPHGGTGTIVDDKHKSGINFGNRLSVNANYHAGLNGNANPAINSLLDSNNKANNYQYGVPLGTILPCLKNRSLPLYLFQEYRILITVEFHDADEWMNDVSQVQNQTLASNPATAGNTNNLGMVAPKGSITYEDIKLQVDYLIMPSEIQAQSRAQLNAEGGLRLDFFDIIKVEKNIPAATPNAKQVVEHRIGADNKEVHKIYMIKRLNRSIGGSTLAAGAAGGNNTADKANGAKVSVPTLTDGAGVGLTLNLTIAGTQAPVAGAAAGNAVVNVSGYGYKAGDKVRPIFDGFGAGTNDVEYTLATGSSDVGGANRAEPMDRLLIGARCDGMNQEDYNVNIDGVDIFQEDKFSPASQYDELTNCLGTDLQLPRPFFFCDENSIASRIADEEGGVLGKYKPLCLDLQNGEPVIVGGGRNIGAYPIIWKYSRTPLDLFKNPAVNTVTGQTGHNGAIWRGCAQSMEVDYFMMVSRVANVRSTPQGTAVSVSY